MNRKIIFHKITVLTSIVLAISLVMINGSLLLNNYHVGNLIQPLNEIIGFKTSDQHTTAGLLSKSNHKVVGNPENPTTRFIADFSSADNWIISDTSKIRLNTTAKRIEWNTSADFNKALSPVNLTFQVGDNITLITHYIDHSDSNTRQCVLFGFIDSLFPPNYFGDTNNTLCFRYTNYFGNAQQSMRAWVNGSHSTLDNEPNYPPGTEQTWKVEVLITDKNHANITTWRNGALETQQRKTVLLAGMKVKYFGVWNQEVTSGLSIQGSYEGWASYLSVSSFYISHDPIVITKNSDFTNLGFIGNGTKENPYIISGLNITGNPVNSSEDLITISDVNVHYSISNNFIRSGNKGIVINDAPYVTIKNNILRECNQGMVIEQNYMTTTNEEKTIIKNNIIKSNDQQGLYLTRCDYVQIINNTIEQHWLTGIRLESLHSATIINNSIESNDYGLKLLNNEKLIIENNEIINSNVEGINVIGNQNKHFLFNNNRIKNNNNYDLHIDEAYNLTFKYNDFGNSNNFLTLNGSSHIFFTLNDIRYATPSTAIKIIEETTTIIFSIEGCGNYWSDYSGNDTDNDDIGDTRYIITDLFIDLHPLIYPSSYYRDFNVNHIPDRVITEGSIVDLQWSPNCNNPSNYSIYINNTLNYSDSSWEGDKIIFDLSSLDCGEYTFELFLFNTSGSTRHDIVKVKVVPFSVPPLKGDWIIDSYLSIVNETLVVDGHVIITKDSCLKLINSTLIFKEPVDVRQYVLNVSVGGILNITEGSIIRPITPGHYYGIKICGNRDFNTGGLFEMHGGRIEYASNFYRNPWEYTVTGIDTQKGSSVFLYDSTFIYCDSLIIGSDGSKIINCSFLNPSHGIVLGRSIIDIYGSSVIVEDCYIETTYPSWQSTSEGILIRGINNVVRGCTIVDTTGVYLRIFYLVTRGPTYIEDNVLTGASRYAICLENTNNTYILNNSFDIEGTIITSNGYPSKTSDNIVIINNTFLFESQFIDFRMFISNWLIMGNKLFYEGFSPGIIMNMTGASNCSIYFNEFHGLGSDPLAVVPLANNSLCKDGLGNYWSNYAGSDNDHDDIGDSPYELAEGTSDPCPLMHSLDYYCSFNVNHLQDETFVIGMTSTLTWNPRCDNPSRYIITINGNTYVNETWNGEVIVFTYSSFIKEEGTYEITLTLYNQSGSFRRDSLIITASFDKTPPIIDSPDDYRYVVGTTGHIITWTPQDNYPRNYSIYRNNSLIITGDWNGSPISLSIDGLSEANWSFKIIVQDIGNNTVEDTVLVTVFNAPPPEVQVIYPNGGEILEGVVDVIWERKDNNSFEVIYSLYYTPNGGKNWYLISDELTITHYYWDTITLTNGNNYLIKVVIKDEFNREEFDTSDNLFSVTNNENSTHDSETSTYNDESSVDSNESNDNTPLPIIVSTTTIDPVDIFTGFFVISAVKVILCRKKKDNDI